jgi:hypothetical protein
VAKTQKGKQGTCRQTEKMVSTYLGSQASFPNDQSPPVANLKYHPSEESRHAVNSEARAWIKPAHARRVGTSCGPKRAQGVHASSVRPTLSNPHPAGPLAARAAGAMALVPSSLGSRGRAEAATPRRRRLLRAGSAGIPGIRRDSDPDITAVPETGHMR